MFHLDFLAWSWDPQQGLVPNKPRRESGTDSRKAGRQWVSVGAQGGSQQQLESHWVLALLQALLPGFWKPPESQQTAVCCLRVWESSSRCQGLLANCLLTAVEFTLELLYAWK